MNVTDVGIGCSSGHWQVDLCPATAGAAGASSAGTCATATRLPASSTSTTRMDACLADSIALRDAPENFGGAVRRRLECTAITRTAAGFATEWRTRASRDITHPEAPVAILDASAYATGRKSSSAFTGGEHCEWWWPYKCCCVSPRWTGALARVVRQRPEATQWWNCV